ILWRMWPFPLMIYLSGSGWCCIASIVAFMTLFVPTAIGLQSAVATVIAMQTLRMLTWWKAIPVLVIVAVVWLMSVSAEARYDSDRASGSSGGGGTFGGWGAPGAKAKPKLDVPSGATAEVARVLGALDFYEVLEVPRGADDETVRKAKRAKSLATHPDKLGGTAVGAKEAFQRVTEAADVLADAAKRRDYDNQLRREEEIARGGSSGGGGGSMGGMGGDGQGAEMPCRSCRGMHSATLTEISPLAGRFCSSCNLFHPAAHGDCWIDKQGGFFARSRVYVCFGEVVLDITEYAKCNNMLHNEKGESVEPNSCKVPFKFGLDGGTAGGGGKASSAGFKCGGKKGRGKRR
ncbi:hypothetical protein FOA52_011854, partial [Chlamydomonas sp. UWO 241]